MPKPFGASDSIAVLTVSCSASPGFSCTQRKSYGKRFIHGSDTLIHRRGFGLSMYYMRRYHIFNETGSGAAATAHVRPRQVLYCELRYLHGEHHIGGMDAMREIASTKSFGIYGCHVYFRRSASDPSSERRIIIKYGLSQCISSRSSDARPSV